MSNLRNIDKLALLVNSIGDIIDHADNSYDTLLKIDVLELVTLLYKSNYIEVIDSINRLYGLIKNIDNYQQYSVDFIFLGEWLENNIEVKSC